MVVSSAAKDCESNGSLTTTGDGFGPPSARPLPPWTCSRRGPAGSGGPSCWLQKWPWAGGGRRNSRRDRDGPGGDDALLVLKMLAYTAQYSPNAFQNLCFISYLDYLSWQSLLSSSIQASWLHPCHDSSFPPRPLGILSVPRCTDPLTQALT